MIKNASQNFVPIKEVKEGILILNNGNMRVLLSTTSLNLSLKSEDEQIGIITGFQTFLNSLDFSIEIFLQSKKLDIRSYLSLLRERQNEVEEDLLKIQIKEYIDFIQKFTEEQSIMTKIFYVVIPYDVINVVSNTKRMSQEDFVKNRNQIMQRVSIVSSGLSSLGLSVKMAETEELVNLFYKLFNPNELDTPKGNN
ncbi:MAG: hypothetical protein KBD12_00480 [Candidatus Pacebacteria bacterium]|nr:hypothetical protein [Candidatus Paceibacterota bacterium]